MINLRLSQEVSFMNLPSLKQEKILTKEFKICFYLLEHKRVVEKNLDLFYFEESIRFY